MQKLYDFYYLVFYFWFRFDLFTKSRENKALKAVAAFTVVQAWLLFGVYWWSEILLGLPSISKSAFLAMFVVLFTGNVMIMRRGEWETFERRFALRSRRARLAWLAVAGGASVVAFAVPLSAGIVARSGH